MKKRSITWYIRVQPVADFAASHGIGGGSDKIDTATDQATLAALAAAVEL
jgi:hypothetical protein